MSEPLRTRVDNLSAREIGQIALRRVEHVEDAQEEIARSLGVIMSELGDVKGTLQTILELLARERGVARE